MLLGKHDARLKLFRTREGDRIYDISNGVVEAAIREWAPNGVQLAADTVGDIAFLESLYPIMRRFSHISSAGFYGQDGRIDIQKMRDREMTLHAPAGWTKVRMDATLDLLSLGELETRHLITHRMPASRASEAFDLILNRRDGVLGVVLEWG